MQWLRKHHSPCFLMLCCASSFASALSCRNHRIHYQESAVALHHHAHWLLMHKQWPLCEGIIMQEHPLCGPTYFSLSPTWQWNVKRGVKFSFPSYYLLLFCELSTSFCNHFLNLLPPHVLNLNSIHICEFVTSISIIMTSSPSSSSVADLPVNLYHTDI